MSLTRRCRPNIINPPQPLRWNPEDRKSKTVIKEPGLFKEAVKRFFSETEKRMSIDKNNTTDWKFGNNLKLKLDDNNLSVETKASDSAQDKKVMQNLSALYSMLIIKKNLTDNGFYVAEEKSKITATKTEDGVEKIVEIKIQPDDDLFLESKNYGNESECRQIIDVVSKSMEYKIIEEESTIHVKSRQVDRIRDDKKTRNIQYQHRSEQRDQNKLHR